MGGNSSSSSRSKGGTWTSKLYFYPNIESESEKKERMEQELEKNAREEGMKNKDVNTENTEDKENKDVNMENTADKENKVVNTEDMKNKDVNTENREDTEKKVVKTEDMKNKDVNTENTEHKENKDVNTENTEDTEKKVVKTEDTINKDVNTENAEDKENKDVNTENTEDMENKDVKTEEMENKDVKQKTAVHMVKESELENKYVIGHRDLKKTFKQFLDIDDTINYVHSYRHKLSRAQITSVLLHHLIIYIYAEKSQWSIEKNAEGITLQRSKHSSDVVLYYYNQLKRSSSVEEIKFDRSYKTIRDLIKWLYKKGELKKPYHVSKNNCQTFGQRVYKFLSNGEKAYGSCQQEPHFELS